MPKATKITKTQLLRLINELEQKPEDKVRILGDVGIAVLGTGLGAAAAGTIAAAAGVTSIFGVTSVAGWLGLTVVSATPIGWVLGGAAVAGATAYTVSRLIRNGGMSEGKKAELLSKYRDEVRIAISKEETCAMTEGDRTKFIVALRGLISKDVVQPEMAFRFIEQVERGGLQISEAFALIEDMSRCSPLSDSVPMRNPKNRLG